MRNIDIARSNGWNQDVALCDRILGRLALATGDTAAAGGHLTAAAAVLRDGEYLALAARARIAATRATADDPDPLYSGRDAADAAIRLAARHQLAWCELDALRAHAVLDQAEGINRGWAAKADALNARLVPPGLDPDPLGTVERLVAEQKAAEESED